MCGFIPLLLGLGGGSLLGYAGERHRDERRRKQAVEDEMNQMFIGHLEKKPWLINDPDIAKQGKKQFGGAWDGLSTQFKVEAASRQRGLQSAINQLQAVPGGQAYLPQLQAQLSEMQGKGGGAAASGSTLAAPANAPTSALAPAKPTAPTVAPTAAMSMAQTPAAASVTGSSMTGGPAGASTSGANQSPAQPSLEQLRALRTMLPMMADNFDPEQLKAFQNDLADRIKRAETTTTEKPQKPPAELNAVAQAHFHGKGYNDLSPDDKQKALDFYQKFREDPAVAASARSMAAWAQHEDRRDSDRQAAEDRKDKQSQARLAASTRRSKLALVDKLKTNWEMFNKVPHTQEEKQDFVDQQNNEIDEFNQTVEGDRGSGNLPDNFDPGAFKRYSVDPETGGVIAKLTGGSLGVTPGAVHLGPPRSAHAGNTAPPSGGDLPPPPNAKSAIKDASGRVTGYRLNDGTIWRPPAGGAGGTVSASR